MSVTMTEHLEGFALRLERENLGKELAAASSAAWEAAGATEYSRYGPISDLLGKPAKAPDAEVREAVPDAAYSLALEAMRELREMYQRKVEGRADRLHPS